MVPSRSVLLYRMVPTNTEDVKSFVYNGLYGGRHGIRTHDPHVANVVLSQLS
jgi:hypothetical protein